MEDHYYQYISEEEKPLFKISAIFKKESLNLTIFKEQTAWNVNVQKGEIEVFANDHNLNFDEYYENLKRYLKLCPKDVEFKVWDKTFIINVLLKNKMKILYFTCNLQEVDFATNIFNLVDKVFNDKTQLLEKLYHYQEKHADLQEVKEKVEEKLNELIERKILEEQELYNKFISVLNEKKRHIQHLNELLIAFRRGRPTVNPALENKKKANERTLKNNNNKTNNRNTNSKTAPESDSDETASSNNSDNYDTDNEKQKNYAEHESKTTKRNYSPIPSTSKAKITSFITEEESPTSYTLLKRIRTQENSNNLSINLPEKDSIAKMGEKPTKLDGSNNNLKDEESPTVTFNTQDLLDNI